jgi:hypothetical protein
MKTPEAFQLGIAVKSCVSKVADAQTQSAQKNMS